MIPYGHPPPHCPPHQRFVLFLLFSMVIIGFLAQNVITENLFRIDRETKKLVEDRYGVEALKRIDLWEKLIREDRSGSDMEKLEKVNQFINQGLFVNDIIHWKQEDYWATPVEFLATNGGDCEDFSIAKYFTLQKLGVADDKIYLTYVKALRLNQAHMVLTYYKTPASEPLILDNLHTSIKPASQRTDLYPVYSFNGSGLWLAKQRGKGKYLGGSERLQRWQEMLKRMPRETM